MARQEEIEIKIIKTGATQSLADLKKQAEEIKTALGSIKIGDVKGYAGMAKVEKDLATAALNRAKAEKLAADAITAKAKAEKAAATAATAKLKQDQQAAKTSAQQAKTDVENAKAKTQLAKAETELAKAESLRAKAQLQLTQADLAKQNAGAKEAIDLATRRAKLEKETANALTAESKMYVQAQKQSEQRIQAAQREAKEVEKAYQQIQRAAEQAYANRPNTSLQNQIDSMLGIGRETKDAKASMDVFVKSGFFSNGKSGLKELSSGAKEAASSFANLGKSAVNLIKQLAGFYGVAQSLRYALTEMKAMSDEMVTYRKVTGATAQEMEKIRATSYSTAKKYGQTPSDFLSAASEMARAGYGANSAAMAELATKTQLVGDMTAEAASQFLLAVDAGYKYQGNIESLTAVLDAANEVDNNFATSIEKISEGMTLVASLAGSVHVPVEQLIAALGTMTATTQRSGGEMARGLRSIMLNVLGDTTTEIEEGVTVTEENIQSLTDALEKYGDSSIAAARKAGKLINPMQAISSLAKAWKSGKLDESTLFGISKDIAGQRYYNAFSSLIQNYDMYESMLEKIAGSAGSAQKEVDSMLDSWTVKANQLKTTWVELVNNTVSENFIKGLLDGGIAALEFAGNLENLALMAGGAYEAVKSLASGIKNLRSGNAFGGFNLAAGVIGLVVSGVGAWKAAYEKNIRDVQEKAAQSVADALNQASSVQTIEDLAKRYSQIASDGIQAEQGELEELKTLQSELNGLVGEQGTAIDIVNGKYGQTLTALKNLSKQQRETAKDTLRSSLSDAVASFNQSDLNGLKSVLDDRFEADVNGKYRRYSMSNVGLDAYANQVVKDYLDNLTYFKSLRAIGGDTLFFNKPDNAEEIIEFYNEIKGFYEFLGSTTATGEKATKGAKTLGEQYSQMYTQLAQFIKLIDDANAGKIVDVSQALDDLEKSFSEIGGASGSANNAGKAVENAASSFNTLAGAIDAATKAKTAFDDAMKTTKADAFNDYATAFKTLQEEIDAGRVNSTAFYAAARMVLGDAAYNATGGTSQGVMAALDKRGQSGSVREAWDILSATYKNEAGVEAQGYGVYELLTRTKGFNKALTDANGNWRIPELTQADLNLISQQWGEISKDYILAAIDALDQYDTKGEATAEAVKAQQAQNDSNKQAEETTSALTDSQLALAKAEHRAAEAAKEAQEQIQESADNLEAVTESTQGAGESSGEASPAKKSTDELLESLDKVEETLARINATEIDPQISGTISEFLADIAGIRDGIVFDIVSSKNTDASVAAAQTIARDLAIVKALESSGISIPAEVTGTLMETLETVVGYIDNPDTLGALMVTLEANDLLTPEAEAIIAGVQEKKAKIGVETEGLGEANKAITLTAKDRKTDINVKAPNAKNVSAELDDVAKARTATITVKVDDTSGAGNTGATYSQTNGVKPMRSTGGYSGGGSSGNFIQDFFDSRGYGFATGTQHHPGGLSLVNDGSGPELIIDRGRAFIAGGGKPAIVNLQKGAKVFTASQTRSIFAGSGVPAYAQGTRSLSLGYMAPGASPTVISSVDSNGGKYTRDTGEQKDDSDNKSGNNNSGGGKQVDEKAFSNLKEMIDYIIERIGEGLDEQITIIDKQIEELKLQREAAEQQNELEEKQQAVAEAQKDLEEALNERTVRYLGEDGKWHWMADARNVQSAQEKLQDAQKSLADYQDEMAFNAQVEALEKQKEALQTEYDSITKAWNAIQKGVSTPTGELGELLAAVLTGGTPQQQTGAASVRDYLIGTLLKGGSYSGNYDEALDSIAKATAGSPIMPDGTTGTLASLIATGGGLTGSVADALKGGAAGTMASVIGAMGQNGGNINYNYFVNGMQIGSDAASTMTLSQIMSGLTVYAGQ